MEDRLVILAKNVEELIFRLKLYLDDPHYNKDNIYVGNITNNISVTNKIFADKNIRDLFDQWIKEKNCEKIALLWVSGIDFDWDSIHKPNIPNRVSVPTYPFKKDRYWLDTNSAHDNNIADTVPRNISIKSPIKLQNTDDSFFTISKKNNSNLKCEVDDIRSIDDFIISNLAALLQLDPSDIGVEKAFTDLGLDSIIGADLTDRINKKYQVTLDARKIYNYPNVKELSQFTKSTIDQQAVRGSN
jgi:polyketide synthase PksN